MLFASKNKESNELVTNQGEHIITIRTNDLSNGLLAVLRPRSQSSIVGEYVGHGEEGKKVG